MLRTTSLVLDCGILALPVAVDNLQWLGERWGLVDEFGQDNIQQEISRAMTAAPQPILAAEVAIVPEPPRRAYHTPQSTIDAFFYLVGAETPDYLAKWLADHPRDVTHLRKLWERKCSATR